MRRLPLRRDPSRPSWLQLASSSIKALRKAFHPKGFLIPEDLSLRLGPLALAWESSSRACLRRRDETIDGEGQSKEARERAGHAQGI